MATRDLNYMANTLDKIITDANLQLLSDEAYENGRKKAKKGVTFEMQADIGHVQRTIADYRDDMKDMRNHPMQTVIEGKILVPAPQAPKPAPVNAELSPEDKKYLAEFEQLLVKNQVEASFQLRLREIIRLYTQKATEKSITNHPNLAWDLYLLRDEVQAQVFQWQLNSKCTLGDTLELEHARHKTFRAKALAAKIGTIIRREYEFFT